MKRCYTCPVCAYPEMTDPVREGNICPCCGTEFSYDDDLTVTYEQLRTLWIQNGMAWFSPVRTPPITWDPVQQLIEGGVDFVGAFCDTDTTNTQNRYELVA